MRVCMCGILTSVATDLSWKKCRIKEYDLLMDASDSTTVLYVNVNTLSALSIQTKCV